MHNYAKFPMGMQNYKFKAMFTIIHNSTHCVSYAICSIRPKCITVWSYVANIASLTQQCYFSYCNVPSVKIFMQTLKGNSIIVPVITVV